MTQEMETIVHFAHLNYYEKTCAASQNRQVVCTFWKCGIYTPTILCLSIFPSHLPYIISIDFYASDEANAIIGSLLLLKFPNPYFKPDVH